MLQFLSILVPFERASSCDHFGTSHLKIRCHEELAMIWRSGFAAKRRFNGTTGIFFVLLDSSQLQNSNGITFMVMVSLLAVSLLAELSCHPFWGWETEGPRLCVALESEITTVPLVSLYLYSSVWYKSMSPSSQQISFTCQELFA